MSSNASGAGGGLEQGGLEQGGLERGGLDRFGAAAAAVPTSADRFGAAAAAVRASTGRSPVHARGGLIATSQPLATAAGVEVLARGGNAADAAVAVLGALSVLEPMMNGPGGDTFVVYYRAADRGVTAICGSGASAALGTPDAYGRPSRMPTTGLRAAAVPGMVDATWQLLQRLGSGRFGLPALWARAIGYAEGGWPVGPRTLAHYGDAPAEFLPAGKPQPDLAATLSRVAERGPDWFYRGPFAHALEAFSLQRGGFLRAADMAAHSTYVGPALGVRVGDLTFFAPPPPSQGVILLEALGIVGGGSLDPLSAAGVHLMVEAKKRAFADRLAFVGDPAFVPFDPAYKLLRPEFLAARRASIDPDRASEGPGAGEPGDTTSFVVVDAGGDAASVITSNSAAWGCREVVPGTGVLLNNRAGRGFTLEADHPNRLAPGKRTMHTLHCYLAVDTAGEAALLGGTPGGDGQPQWNLQVLMHLLKAGCDPQEAVERPRWYSSPGTDPEGLPAPDALRLESGFSDATVDRLAAMGHKVRTVPRRGGGGAVQVIVRGTSPGEWVAGSDPRADGCAVGL